MKYCETVLNAIGNTPLVKLNKVTEGTKSTILAKVECVNPGGSIKDRIGLSMIDAAEKDGLLKKGGTIIEPTAGNTGVGLALAAAVKGYRSIFIMPDKMSEDKRALLRAYGAEVVVCPTAVTPDSPHHYLNVAKRLAKEIPGAFMPNQYDNPNNPQAHYITTGPEIWKDTSGKIDALVAGMGTAGTITGTAKFLKEKNPKIKVIGADPAGSIFSGDTPKPYLVEGIGEDFIPRAYDPQLVDEVIRITDKESFHTARRLAREEGLLVGGSSGTAVAAALKYAMRFTDEKTIVVILPDTGRNYLTKFLSDQWMQEKGLLDFKAVKIRIVDVLARKQDAPSLIAVSPSDKVTKAISLMHKYQISQLPIIDGNKNMGSVLEETLMKLLYDGTDLSQQAVSSIMSEPLPTLEAETNIAEGYRLLLAGQSAIIVIHEDKPIGIISRMDLVDFWIKEKE
jgi:cystathionine beta-synthase